LWNKSTASPLIGWNMSATNNTTRRDEGLNKKGDC
jgi:hypothetical protein